MDKHRAKSHFKNIFDKLKTINESYDCDDFFIVYNNDIKLPIEGTVGLPVLNGKDIIWLALESLKIKL